MIIVEQEMLGNLEVTFKYYPNYIERIKSLGAKFNPDTKAWNVPLFRLDELVYKFKGEIFFKTPEWEIRNIAPPDYSKLYTFSNNLDVSTLGFKLKPFNYQEFGIKFLVDRLEKNHMAFIADDVGLGKTIQAIGAMKYLFDNNKIKDLVIICKKSLKYQWEEEINRFIDFNGDIYIADDNKKKRHKTYEDIKNNKKNTILIINYHLLMNDSDLISSDMTIYDEVHVAKKNNGEINKACKAVTKNADYCLFMTGTPIMAKPDDIYGIVSIKDKKYFGTAKDFNERYVVEYYNGKYKNIVGYKNLDELREKVQQIILRRTSNEVTIDLPEVMITDKLCAIDGKQKNALAIAEAKTRVTEDKIEDFKKKYKKTDDDNSKFKLKAEIEKLESSLKGFIAVEQAIANSPVLFHYSKSKGIREVYKDVTPSPSYLSNKMQSLLDLVDDIASAGKKAIIFTKYETVVNYVKDLLERQNIITVPYTGKMNDEDRNNSIQSFKRDSNVVAIIGTDALAEGVNLQNANNVIHIDLPFNQAIYNQRNGRARRAGSTHNTVFVYNLITKESIDEKIYSKIKDTKNAFDSFVSVNKAQSELLKELNK